MTEFTPKIIKWANGIAKEEGDISGVNPGNLKYTTLTASWGATRGRPAADKGYFALFPDFQKGFTALCNFLTLGCEDELKDFHQARTFEAFTKVYAGNPPLGYIEGIRQMLGCQMDTDISIFLQKTDIPTPTVSSAQTNSQPYIQNSISKGTPITLPMTFWQKVLAYFEDMIKPI